MSSTGILALSQSPFGTDTVSAHGEYSALYPLADLLGSGLDSDSLLSLQLPWNGQDDISCGHLSDPDNTPSANVQKDQQKSDQPEKPDDAGRDQRTRVKQLPHRRNKAKTTISNCQTRLSQRAQHLERNSLAASRCRQKKKEHTQHVEARFHEETQRKKRLEGDISALHSEILGLKDEILKHALYEDGRVGQHLAHVMHQITHGMSATAGVSSSPMSLSSSASSPLSASLTTATLSAATAASLPDKFSPGVSYIDEGTLSDIHGETLPLGSGALYPSVDGPVTELFDTSTYLT